MRRAASSTKLHWWGMAVMPAALMEPMENSPTPCLPASSGPDGLTIEATAMGISACMGSTWRRASTSVNHSLS